jgi:hypothetical protein
VEIKPFGPDQEYAVIPAGPPVRIKGFPEHTGPLFAAVANGKALTTTTVEAEF